VTNPEKIVCSGLNYRRHAAETGNTVPKMPILFNKFNSALNNHGGTIGVSEEDARQFRLRAELVIVIGRTARIVSEPTPRTTSSAIASATTSRRATLAIRGRSNGCSARRSTAPARSDRGWSPADQVDGDNLKIECRVNGKRGASRRTPPTWCSIASSW